MTDEDDVDVDLSRLVAGRLAEVEDAIASCGRRREDVTVVAVTKGFGVAEVLAANHAGLTLFGENYADELVSKAEQMAGIPGWSGSWTFQGRLQSNKINRLAPHVSLWQTVSTVEQAGSLAKRTSGASVLIQVNLTGRTEQSGASWLEFERVIDAANDVGLDVRGLMGIGPDTEDRSARRNAFERLHRESQRLGLPTTSMGMSADFVDALVAGSTMIRLGSVLFGPRGPASEP